MTDYSAMLPQEIPALPNAIPLTRFNLIALTFILFGTLENRGQSYIKWGMEYWTFENGFILILNLFGFWVVLPLEYQPQ